jgi:hypothetical protein
MRHDTGEEYRGYANDLLKEKHFALPVASVRHLNQSPGPMADAMVMLLD